ncbi:MAG: ABC transporter permease subunit [Planctomycetota bacterium]|nr:ABC transporter permease subunit [Planctomycetota bacterium]
MANDTTQVEAKPLSILQRRWRKFKTLKRGWYSFLALVGLYLLSFLLPILINSKALVVSYEGELYFPAVADLLPFTEGHYSAEELGLYDPRRPDRLMRGEARYRLLQEQYEASDEGNWVLLAPYPYHPNESLLKEASFTGHPPTKPDARNWLGTDDRGRDVLARLAYGFRISITFALLVVAISYLIGMSIGATLGFFGGRVDIFGQRLVEIWAAMPFLYTVIIISSIVQPNLKILVAILAIFYWIGISFYMRGEFLREKSKDYVAGAISIGESNAAIMFKHILPNALTPVISFAPFAIVGGISSLVSLDYLGFGLPHPTPSWGELVGQGLANIPAGAWHLVVFPLGALFGTLLMVVFIGEAIREAFDPKVFSRLR